MSMCGDAKDTVGYNDVHCEKFHKFDAKLKPLEKRLETLRCADTDSAWFEAVVASTEWVKNFT